MVQFGSIIWEVDLWRIFGNHPQIGRIFETHPQIGRIFETQLQIGRIFGIQPQIGRIFETQLQIGPFWGQIRPIWGWVSKIRPIWGWVSKIRPIWGWVSKIRPIWGWVPKIRPIWGCLPKIRPIWGWVSKIRPIWGWVPKIRPIWGCLPKIRPIWSCIPRQTIPNAGTALLPNSNPMWGVLLRQIVGLQPPCDGFPESNPKCDGFSKSNPLLSCVLLCCCFVWSVDYGPCLGWSCCFARKTLCSITSDSEIFCHFSSICVWFCKASVHRSVPKFLSANITLIPVLDAKSSSAGVTCQSWASPSHNQKIRGFSVIWVWYASCFFQTSCDFFSAGWISKMIFLHRFWKSLSFSCADFGFWIKGISTQGKWPQRSAFLRAVRTNGANFQKYVLEMQARNTFWNWHTGVLDWVGRAVVKHVFFWFKCFGPTSGFFLDTVDCINIPTCSISVVFVLR